MGAGVFRRTQFDRQLGLDESWMPTTERPHSRLSTGRGSRKLCAGCRAHEARYGFRHNDHGATPLAERPNTLCFACFRMEIDRRQARAAWLARGWNATQTGLPLAEKLETLARRRRRAQIAARRALELR
jgi:hypothetical protein